MMRHEDILEEIYILFKRLTCQFRVQMYKHTFKQKKIFILLIIPLMTYLGLGYASHYNIDKT